ncbi:6-bladed beta-propeller [Photobacterium sp. SDRW27]|uniref:6-bladed beta-propeller n=1 Tax=Photobacterium obscurum TaxID=2829490 RepID=UPI0022445705|nr:6-bladed beta-propeller [Photobacterium obscurum]MCW8327835.1 6-bladed beta-propeller [Photobacterium obscurum]
MKGLITILCVWLIGSANALAAAPEVIAGKTKFKHVMTIGSKGAGIGQFRYVEDFAIDSQGRLLVTDARNSNVQIFDKYSGEYLGTFEGGSAGKFEKPEGIAVDAVGNIYIADYVNGYIKKYDKDFTHIITFSDFGIDPGENMESEFMTIYENRLYMADKGNNRVDVFDLEGNFLFLFDHKGSLEAPQAAKSTSTGDIYVVDMGNDRVLHFNREGIFKRKLGKYGKRAGEFDKPVGLAIDGRDHIYVSEAHNDRIQVFDQDFNLLATWGEHGSGIGQFKNLHGLLVDERGYVFAADTGNNRIQVFAPQNQ